MVWISAGIVVVGLAVVVGVFLLITRSQQSQHAQAYDGFKILQQNFEGLQRGLMQLQKDFGERQSTQLNQIDKTIQGKLDHNLKEGFKQYELVQQHLKQAEMQLKDLNHVGQAIHNLNDLLKMPHLRGSFGEAMLEQLLADMLPHTQFEFQYRVIPTSQDRVDAIIRYPNAVLPIDSKFPREVVLALFENQDAAALEKARKELQDTMRALGKSIREKYIHPEYGTTEMALLFIPSETIYFEVLRNVKLFDELSRMKVFAVSPNTLAITLHAISISRNYYEMAKGVEQTLEEVRKAQVHFDNFESRFDELGIALTKAQSSFNTASTHLSRYGSAVTRLLGSEEVTPKINEPSLPS